MVSLKEYKPVEIPIGAFNFCKYSIASMLWISLIFKSKELLIAVFCILLLSAYLKVRNAPLVFLYKYSIDKVIPSKKIILDESAVWFAHLVGAAIAAGALIFMHYINPLVGWILVWLLAILKTSGALGFCGAMKLYGCLNNPAGQCCRVGKKIKKQKC